GSCGVVVSLRLRRSRLPPLLRVAGSRFPRRSGGSRDPTTHRAPPRPGASHDAPPGKPRASRRGQTTGPIRQTRAIAAPAAPTAWLVLAALSFLFVCGRSRLPPLLRVAGSRLPRPTGGRRDSRDTSPAAAPRCITRCPTRQTARIPARETTDRIRRTRAIAASAAPTVWRVPASLVGAAAAAIPATHHAPPRPGASQDVPTRQPACIPVRVIPHRIHQARAQRVGDDVARHGAQVLLAAERV